MSGAIGAQTTLIVAGTLGAIVTFGALFIPGMRDVERARADGPRPEPAHAEPSRAEPAAA
jgi:hypothetical protein